MPFAATWISLEDALFSEISQVLRGKYDLVHMYGLLKNKSQRYIEEQSRGT